jgi:predicted nucleic acid-binding Zn ribbon protein
MNQYFGGRSEYKINEAIAEFLDKYRLRDGYTGMQIATIWKETIGKNIARYTKQIELKDNKLTLYVTSPVVKKELLMLRSEIIAQLNKKIGKELVQEIDIR